MPHYVLDGRRLRLERRRARRGKRNRELAVVPTAAEGDDQRKSRGQTFGARRQQQFLIGERGQRGREPRAGMAALLHDGLFLRRNGLLRHLLRGLTLQPLAGASSPGFPTCLESERLGNRQAPHLDHREV